MLHFINLLRSVSFFLFISLIFFACSKPGTTAVDCSSKTIAITATTIPASTPTNTDGSITATATGSSGFTYSIAGGAFQTSGTFTSLAAGSYLITTKDADNCTATSTVNLTATACPTITVTAVVTPASSATATNGSIVASAAGSTGFTFSINGTTFQPTGSFTNLAIGNYTVTAKAANGCTGTALFTVSAATCPTITVTGNSTNTAGPTATDGSITASGAGGAAPYTFSINGTTFQSSGTFTNLAVGNYTIIAKDANGCTGSSAVIAVASTPCPTITINTAVVPSDKCSNNTGRITVTASGSTGFSYSINAGAFQASNVFNGLTTGTFAITVRNANGCTNTANATVIVAPNGVTFSQVKTIMLASCATPGCHTGANPQSGINFADDCTIVSRSARIKARAVDNVPSVMPPSGALSASDKQKILDWIAAGSQQSN